MTAITSYDFLTSIESNIIADHILNIEDDVKAMGDDVFKGKGQVAPDSLSGRHWCYNYLRDDPVKSIVVPKLIAIFGKCTVQCWANTFRKGEGIKPHAHGRGHTSANIFLRGDPEIGTWYERVKYKNCIGEMTVFPSEMQHGVPENPTDNIRISMAMDIFIGETDPIPPELENRYIKLT